MTFFFLPSYKKANLEMNKEGLAADLVCLLDERSKPRNSAKFQEQIERFFIAGAARIDLIAKVMDLDNEIGGHNFDILNLEETANEIESLRSSGGKDLCDYTSRPCAYDRTQGRAHAEGHVWLYILAKMSHQVKLEGHVASRFPC